MTNPRFANDDDWKRGRFYDIDGQQYLSVTNICGVVAKPALVAWSAKLAAERAMQHVDTWQSIEAEEGFEAARKWISKASREYTDTKATIGSAVHFCCENIDTLMDEEVQATLDWYLAKLPGDRGKNRANIFNHVEQFREFIAVHSPAFLAREQTVFHNTMMYAGTLDACVTFGDQPEAYILDIKTGNAAQYKTTHMQLAAYRFATGTINDHGDRTPFALKPVGGYVLELKPRSYKLTEVPCGETVFEAFRHALALKRFTDE